MPDVTKPESGLADDVTQLLVAMGMRLNRHFAAQAAECGLAPAEGKVVMALLPEQARPMRSLADTLGLDASNLTGVVDRLEARDAVRRRPDGADRRVKAVVLTGEGARLREWLSQRLRGVPGPVRGLSDPELEQLRELLRRAMLPEL